MPQPVAMRARADRRVHLRIRAKPGIGILRRQRQVLGRDFARGDIAVLRDQFQFGRRGDVQHVDRPLRLARQPQDAPGRQHRALVVAPDRMAGGIAFDAEVLARVHPRLVLGVDGDTAAAASQNAGQRLILGHQQVAGRRAHEDLDARGTGNPLQFRQMGCILGRRTDVEGVIAVHPVVPACQLVEHAVCRVSVGIGIGHLEHRGDPAHHRRAAAAFQVFLVLQPRLAKVHLAVDDAGQHVQPGAIDAPPLIGIAADADDLAIAHRNVGMDRTRRRVDQPASQNEFGGKAHRVDSRLPQLPVSREATKTFRREDGKMERSESV